MKILFISSPAGGRGRGEGGMTSDGIPLTAALGHPGLSDSYKKAERDFILSPRGEDSKTYFLSNPSCR
jgi:hypothetical protein